MSTATPKKYGKLVLLCVAIYFVSYLTRINYAAIIVEFAQSTGLGEENASLALTGLAIFYGTGQVLSGYLGDRIKPKILISTGLATSAVMNFCLPLCTASVPLLTTVWCINGLAQAMMWPPIVKTLTFFLSAEEYKKASIKVSYGAQAASISVYLLAPVCIKFSGWQIVFYIASACAVLMSVLVAIKMPEVDIVKSSATASASPAAKMRIPVILFGIAMFVTMLQGIMRDGTTNWLPSYIKSSFGVSSEIAILIGVAPPLFTLVCYEITSFLNRKVFRNEMTCAFVIFAVGFAASAVLSAFHSSNIVLSVVLGTLVIGCMHGVNVILTCLLPRYFAKTGKVAFVSGLLNSCTYVGSAVSGYGFAAVSAGYGWGGTIVLWAAICFAAAGICIAVSGKWNAVSQESAD